MQLLNIYLLVYLFIYLLIYLIIYLFIYLLSMQLEHAQEMFKNYWDKCEKRRCSCSHKQCKTVLKDHLVRFKLISLCIYKDLRLKT